MTLKAIKNKYLYVIQMLGTSYFKVGVSNCIKRRLENLQTGNPIKLYVVRYWQVGDKAEQIEQLVHSYLSAYHIRLEWFEFDVLVLGELEKIVLERLVLNEKRD